MSSEQDPNHEAWKNVLGALGVAPEVCERLAAKPAPPEIDLSPIQPIDTATPVESPQLAKDETTRGERIALWFGFVATTGSFAIDMTANVVQSLSGSPNSNDFFLSFISLASAIGLGVALRKTRRH